MRFPLRSAYPTISQTKTLIQTSIDDEYTSITVPLPWSTTASPTQSLATETQYKTTESSKGQLDVLTSLSIGAVSGMIGITTVYPVDVVKTRLQSISGVSPSAISVFKKILTTEGPRSFYKGLIPQLCGTGPDKAVSLATRDLISKWQTNPHTTQSLALAAAGAGAVQSFVMNPVEIVKVRLQLNSSQNFMQIVRSLGINGLYRGYRACALRDIVFSSTYFTLYETAKKYMNAENEDGSKNLIVSLVAATAAGAPAAFITTPLDVLKTRLQATEVRSNSLIKLSRHIAAEEGGRALFKGWGPRVTRIAPQFGVVLVTYEYLSETVLELLADK